MAYILYTERRDPDSVLLSRSGCSPDRDGFVICKAAVRGSCPVASATGAQRSRSGAGPRFPESAVGKAEDLWSGDYPGGQVCPGGGRRPMRSRWSCRMRSMIRSGWVRSSSLGVDDRHRIAVLGELSGQDDRDRGLATPALGVRDGEYARHAVLRRCGSPAIRSYIMTYVASCASAGMT